MTVVEKVTKRANIRFTAWLYNHSQKNNELKIAQDGVPIGCS